MKCNSIIIKVFKHIKWLFNSFIEFPRYCMLVKRDTILFISHNGDTAGGAPVVLYELIKKIKYKHKVILLCEKPGQLIDLCRRTDIHAFSIYGMQKVYIIYAKIRLVKNIIVNTIACANTIKFLSNIYYKHNVLWWIHEEDRLIDKYCDRVPARLKGNFKILCVSQKVQEKIILTFPDLKESTTVFYYGCQDLLAEISNVCSIHKNKYIINVIGRICERKNQIQVVNAINMLDSRILDKIEVRFIYGSYDKDYFDELYNVIENKSYFKLIGAVSREKMPEVYLNGDLVICSSVEDPLPVVVTEAMMFMCPFITSSNTGQFYLIKNGFNGFTYDVKSTEELSNRIIEVMNFSDMEFLKKNERVTYLNYFDIKKIEEEFEKLLEL